MTDPTLFLLPRTEFLNLISKYSLGLEEIQRSKLLTYLRQIAGSFMRVFLG